MFRSCALLIFSYYLKIDEEVLLKSAKIKILLSIRTKFRKLFKPLLSSGTCLPFVARVLNSLSLNVSFWNRDISQIRS